MKVYVRAMAFDRKLAMEKIQSLSKNIEDNIIKLCIFEDNLRDQQHWMDELATWFDAINRVTLKSKTPKFTSDDYGDWVFGAFGTTYSDCRLSLLAWKANNQRTKKYPDVKLTNTAVNQLFSAVSQLRETFNDLFSSKNSYKRYDMLAIIEEIFDYPL